MKCPVSRHQFHLCSLKRSWLILYHSPTPTFRLSDFSQPVSFEQAEIGQCPNLAPPPPPAPLPDEEEPDKEGKELKPTQASTPPEPSAVSDINMLTLTQTLSQ